MIAPLPIPAESLLEQYGQGARLCTCANDQITLVFSQEYPFDLVELEQLLEAVGWSRRPIRRVRKALSHSLLKVGLWRHDPPERAAQFSVMHMKSNRFQSSFPRVFSIISKIIKNFPDWLYFKIFS